MRAWAFLVVAACSAPAPASADAKKEASMPDLSIEWSVKKSDGQLQIAYTLANHSKKPVFVADVMVVGGDPAADAVVVLRGEPGQVRFVKGDVPPLYSKVSARSQPGLRPLAAGATVTGTARAALPLKESHPVYHEERELPGPVTTGVLEVHVYPGDVDQVSTTLANGTAMHWAKQTAPAPQTVRSAPATLPR